MGRLAPLGGWNLSGSPIRGCVLGIVRDNTHSLLTELGPNRWRVRLGGHLRGFVWIRQQREHQQVPRRVPTIGKPHAPATLDECGYSAAQTKGSRFHDSPAILAVTHQLL